MQQHSKARTTLTAILLASTLAACTAATSDTPRPAVSGVAEVRTASGEVIPAAIVAGSDADILGLLHESNLAGIAAGTLAEQNATRPEVKAYARRMVEQHRSLDEQASAAAARMGITPTLPDSALPRRHQSAMSALRRASWLDFEPIYLDQQVNAHRRTLALIDAAIIGAQRAELKVALQNDLRPHVLGHLRAAETLRRGSAMMP